VTLQQSLKAPNALRRVFLVLLHLYQHLFAWLSFEPAQGHLEQVEYQSWLYFSFFNASLTDKLFLSRYFSVSTVRLLAYAQCSHSPPIAAVPTSGISSDSITCFISDIVFSTQLKSPS